MIVMHSKIIVQSGPGNALQVYAFQVIPLLGLVFLWIKKKLEVIIFD